jgi:hypothetical protein
VEEVVEPTTQKCSKKKMGKDEVGPSKEGPMKEILPFSSKGREWTR